MHCNSNFFVVMFYLTCITGSIYSGSTLKTAVAVTAHVVSVESEAKLTLEYIMSVESFNRRLRLMGFHVEWVFEKITATWHFSFDNVLELEKGGNACKNRRSSRIEGCTIKDRQFQTAHPVWLNAFISHVMSVESCNRKITLNLCITCCKCREWSFLLRLAMYIRNSKSLNYNMSGELKLVNYTKLQIKHLNYNHFELNYM